MRVYAPHGMRPIDEEPDVSYRVGEALAFVPAEYHEDPALTRQSVRGLLELEFSVFCFDHGVPLLDDPKAALRALLAQDTEASHRGSPSAKSHDASRT